MNVRPLGAQQVPSYAAVLTRLKLTFIVYLTYKSSCHDTKAWFLLVTGSLSVSLHGWKPGATTLWAGSVPALCWQAGASKGHLGTAQGLLLVPKPAQLAHSCGSSVP